MTEEKRKDYTFVGATRVGESLKDNNGKPILVQGKEVYNANITTKAFIASEPTLETLPTGDTVLKYVVGLFNTGKKITGAVGLEGVVADETIWANVTLFDRPGYDIATKSANILKKGMMIALFGQIRPREYDGKVFYNITENRHAIVWSRDKGLTVGGEYSPVSARKANKEGLATIGALAVVGSEPEVKTTQNGKEFLSFAIGLNKASKELNYPLGLQDESQRDLTWATVNVWDNEGFALKSRAEKAIRKGQYLLIHGMMSANKGDKGIFYNINLDDFDIVRKVGEKNGQNNNASQPAPDEKYSSAATSVDIPLDDEIPF